MAALLILVLLLAGHSAADDYCDTANSDMHIKSCLQRIHKTPEFVDCCRGADSALFADVDSLYQAVVGGGFAGTGHDSASDALKQDQLGWYDLRKGLIDTLEVDLKAKRIDLYRYWFERIRIVLARACELRAILPGGAPAGESRKHDGVE